VAGFSAKFSADKYGKPVVKGDFGFFIECLNGLPGPYIKDFVDKLGIKRFLELIKDENNRRAYLVYVLAYCEPGKEPVIFTSRFDGVLVNKLRSSEKWFTDAFLPDGQKLTMGEMRDQDKEGDFEFFGDVENKFAEWYNKQKLL